MCTKYLHSCKRLVLKMQWFRQKMNVYPQITIYQGESDGNHQKFLPASSLQIGLVHLCSFLNMNSVGLNVCTPVLYQCLVSLHKNSFDCLYSHSFTTVCTSLSDQKVFPRAFFEWPMKWHHALLAIVSCRK